MYSYNNCHMCVSHIIVNTWAIACNILKLVNCSEICVVLQEVILHAYYLHRKFVTLNFYFAYFNILSRFYE